MLEHDFYHPINGIDFQNKRNNSMGIFNMNYFDSIKKVQRIKNISSTPATSLVSNEKIDENFNCGIYN
jgi:hypothetical protein